VKTDKDILSHEQDRGLIKRGFFLLALIAALVVVVLFILFQRPGRAMPAVAQRPELLAASLVRSDATFPSSVSWSTIAQLGEAFPSAEGWKIRYNAAAALARRGSDQVPWLTLIEMLDEDRQMRNFRVQLESGSAVPDEAAARLTMVAALKAIGQWHKKQANGNKAKAPELVEVYAAVDKLASSPIMEVKMQAENTRQTFFR
jgi:hypothetical protein